LYSVLIDSKSELIRGTVIIAVEIKRSDRHPPGNFDIDPGLHKKIVVIPHRVDPLEGAEIFGVLETGIQPHRKPAQEPLPYRQPHIGIRVILGRQNR
jgi:hypothetical protein